MAVVPFVNSWFTLDFIVYGFLAFPSTSVMINVSLSPVTSVSNANKPSGGLAPLRRIVYNRTVTSRFLASPAYRAASTVEGSWLEKIPFLFLLETE